MEDTKSVLIVVTSYARIDAQHPTGLWFEEFAVPYERFVEAGYLVTVASIKGGKVPIDPRSLPGDQDAMTVRGPMAALQHSQRLMEVDVSEYDAVFFSGGHGTMFDFPRSREVAELVVNYLERGKVVAAVCHGPAALTQAKYRDGSAVVKGRKLTGFSNEEERTVQLDALMPFLLEDKLRNLGAEVEVAPQWQAHVVVDGNLITGQNPQSSLKSAEALIQALSA
ncbi:MAG: type 1 glutamine amidotransferase domain-containing protein [Gammaproteobacteria bacterium]|jgi:putative intracellular protease/amidase